MAIMPPLPEPMTVSALQAWVKEMKAANGWTPTDFRHELVFLMEEVGELAKAHRKARPGSNLTDTQMAQQDSLGEELADVLIYLLSLGNVAGVDIAAAFAQKIEQNRNREWKKNTLA